LTLGQEPELALHLPEVPETPLIERAIFECGSYGAARFVPVTAVAKVTPARPRLDVRERALEIALFAPELQFAQARSVHEQATAGQRYQFAPGGDVPALAGGLADLAGLRTLGAEQAVDDAGLADARRPNESYRFTGAHIGPDFVKANAGSGGDD
jgi:hypothetical protein